MVRQRLPAVQAAPKHRARALRCGDGGVGGEMGNNYQSAMLERPSLAHERFRDIKSTLFPGEYSGVQGRSVRRAGGRAGRRTVGSGGLTNDPNSLDTAARRQRSAAGRKLSTSILSSGTSAARQLHSGRPAAARARLRNRDTKSLLSERLGVVNRSQYRVAKAPVRAQQTHGY